MLPSLLSATPSMLRAFAKGAPAPVGNTFGDPDRAAAMVEVPTPKGPTPPVVDASGRVVRAVSQEAEKPREPATGILRARASSLSSDPSKP